MPASQRFAKQGAAAKCFYGSFMKLVPHMGGNARVKAANKLGLDFLDDIAQRVAVTNPLGGCGP